MSDRASKDQGRSGPTKVTRSPKYLKARDRLRLMAVEDLLRIKHPPSHHHWGALITSGMTGMLYGPRGSGKTYASLGIAVSMASGLKFLGLRPSRPRKVVVLDGEMGSKLMKRRVKEMCASLGAKSSLDLQFLTPDMYSHVLPSLATQAGQKAVDAVIPDDTDVIVVDNVSCWNRGGGEDADGWNPWAEWLLKHKHMGRTVLVIHHAGKGGQQRGTSKREDTLDFVMALKPAKDLEHPKALCFDIAWEKLRDVGKGTAPPLRVTRVEPEGGPPRWAYREQLALDDRIAQAKVLKDEGKTLEAIGRELGADKSTVSRWLRSIADDA